MFIWKIKGNNLKIIYMGNFLSELGDVLFLDIETASLESEFVELPIRLQEEWLKKEKHIKLKDEEIEPGSLFFHKAGIFAEFGKVICVGVGYFHFLEEENKLEFRTKSYAEESEYDTLAAFCELLSKKKWILCAHNGKEFDFPYLSRTDFSKPNPTSRAIADCRQKTLGSPSSGYFGTVEIRGL
jgi:3'-5' exonuclease